MPYAIYKYGDKYQVRNQETQDVRGTFPSRKAALQQLRALYANIPDAGKKGFDMEIVTKSVMAELVPQADEGQVGPGFLHAIVSSERRDRDGEQLWADEWEQPLPEHIQVIGDHDNNHIMSTVGSGTPTLENDNKIHVRGTYATTGYAQDARKLVNGRHLRTLSVAYREKKGEKGVRRELINASFVNVPSNTDCVVLESKNFEPNSKASGGTTEGNYDESEGPFADKKNRKWPLNTRARILNAWARIHQGPATSNYSASEVASMKAIIQAEARKRGIKLEEHDKSAAVGLILKQFDSMTPDDRIQAIHDMAYALGAECGYDDGYDPDGEPETKSYEVKDNNDGMWHVYVKDGMPYRISQAPQAPPKEADSAADLVKEKALAIASAMTRTLTASQLD